MTDGTQGAVEIKAGDLPFVRYGCDLVEGAAKNAMRLNMALDIDKSGNGAHTAGDREAQAIALRDLIDECDPEKPQFSVPPHLVRCARIGVALELGKVNDAREGQIKLKIEDTKPIDKRTRQLERILNTLDGQGELAIEDDK